MISDYIKKIENRLKRSRDKKRILKSKYWKMSASERLHYDSLKDKIDHDNFGLMNLTFLWIKISVFIPVFMVIAALFTNQLEVIVPLAQNIFKRLIASTLIMFKIDIIQFLIFKLLIIPEETEELQKRFGLVK